MIRSGTALLLVFVIWSCAPKPGDRPEMPSNLAYAYEAFPTELAVEPNHQRLALSWRKTGQAAISGYNIYISDRPLAARYPGQSIDTSIKSFNPEPFLGDTDPGDSVEHFDATGLTNGVRYYVTARAVYPDWTISRPSNEVIAVCGGRGEIELAVRYFGKPDGYSFEKNEYVECDAEENDLYFFSKNGDDYLASPRRLDGFINDTRFLVLPIHGDYAEVAAWVRDSMPVVTDDQGKVAAGDWVLLSCGRGTRALVQVRELKGLDRERRVVLFFAYSSLVGEMSF